MKPYVLHAGEGAALWFLGSRAVVKATGAETQGRLSVAEFVNPAGFATPLHRHLHEDEMFYVLSGTAEFRCDGESLLAGAGDFVLLPAGLAHGFVVGAEEPLRALQLTTPGGFEKFVAEVGEPATGPGLPPEVTPVDPVLLGHAAARHGIELLGPPLR
ncbi:hypothetical protein GCM10010168_74850 [Actinoplanes ianthinogenes]|uniref:Cupin type-2 domain-containing protein n=1 Tax=Actinoplanes ianthinogenes TaxID=122358 RepID=A0ABM7LRE0_9ACTN|nr:quercetin 2,3-dioxygenase [Actinoplanes ianthinogenes]BCJ41797.1 hypothetical protein Aiant_24540 [Actinoplanes ianthinogenes]GGR45022.1 hypothetical protein GCM10010168_74850 [Actinoplanes ianthinogenes]